MENIKQSLTSWCKAITSKFFCLKVRFEFNDDMKVYLVSLNTNQVENLEELSREVLSFEGELVQLYGDDAPLFCDNEELFQLSDKAETYVSFQNSVEPINWGFSLLNDVITPCEIQLIA